jgi:hypothetical protein
MMKCRTMKSGSPRYPLKCGPRDDTYDIYIHIDESHHKSVMNKPTAESLFGFNAGVVWEALNQNGPSNIRNLVKTTSLSREEVYGALGWLGREDKLVMERKGRALAFSLRETEAHFAAPKDTTIEDSAPQEQSLRKVRTPPKKSKKARKVKSPASSVPLVKKALDFILSELDANREPTPGQVSQAVGLGSRQLGIALSKLDIKSESIRREGKCIRIYPLDSKARAWELAGLDTEGLQKIIEAKAKATENDKEQGKEQFTVFD